MYLPDVRLHHISLDLVSHFKVLQCQANSGRFVFIQERDSLFFVSSCHTSLKSPKDHLILLNMLFLHSKTHNTGLKSAFLRYCCLQELCFTDLCPCGLHCLRAARRSELISLKLCQLPQLQKIQLHY